jgi:hypothetical protein
MGFNELPENRFIILSNREYTQIQFSLDLTGKMISVYWDKWRAFVNKDRENNYYIFYNDKCAKVFGVENVEPAILALGAEKSKEVKYISEAKQKLKSISVSIISSKVSNFLSMHRISVKNIDDKVVSMIDKKIAGLIENGSDAERIDLFVDCYLLVGEYFRYAFKNKYKWVIEFDKQGGEMIPVLKHIETNELVYIFDSTSKIFESATPLTYAVEFVYNNSP